MRPPPVPAPGPFAAPVGRRAVAQATIDEHKLARGLTRISLDELLDVLTRMGYREA
ncbi:MAG: hypothetical protein IMZ44_06410 [Planctomycetes bacterium]|nr:hypothetical protein [Planctomycetota bacterium]